MTYRIKSIESDTIEVTRSSAVPALGEHFTLKIPREKFDCGPQLVEGKEVTTKGDRWVLKRSLTEAAREKLEYFLKDALYRLGILTHVSL